MAPATRPLLRLPLLMIMLVACGEDEAPPPPPAPPGGAPAPAGGGPKPPPGNQLQPRGHVEEHVVCPVPDKPTGPACKPESPTCEVGKFCIQVGAGWSCEPCTERDTIRHDFKDRDFAAGSVRDPFQSYIIAPKGLETGPVAKPEGPCNRIDQFQASNFSYLELRLVGIVAQGTRRKVLMMGGNQGYIIRRGDCVGKEKALVKDIGTDYVTFIVQPDADSTAKVPEERSMQLHPKGLQITPQPLADTPAAPTAPVVAPGGSAALPAQAPPASAPTAPAVSPR